MHPGQMTAYLQREMHSGTDPAVREAAQDELRALPIAFPELCDFGSWPLNLPPAPIAKTRPRCSYCRFLTEGDRCGNCGAPQ